jgi:hypothetical protein
MAKEDRKAEKRLDQPLDLSVLQTFTKLPTEMVVEVAKYVSHHAES